MKKIFITTILALSILNVAFAQSNITDSLSLNIQHSGIDSLARDIKDIVVHSEPSFEEKIERELLNIYKILKRETEGENFKMYPTNNIWTFLKLDTRNGVITQVQYSTNGPEYRFETYLSNERLISDSEEPIPGRFELYPTQNTYNFILLDKKYGRCWQVQWGKAHERMVIRIY